MEEYVNLSNVLNIYENIICKNVKNKQKLFLFERNKMQNIIEILNVLKCHNYDGGKYNIFLIREPKIRIIMSLSIKDKIINHFFSKYVLEKKLTKDLDIRNIATRKNMGTDYGIKLLKKYLELNKKYEHFYILKLDISKYFYSIDHTVLKNLVKDKLNKEELIFLDKILKSTNKEYINKRINYLKSKNNLDDLPFYEFDKGLPIGNMTSQFLAIYYLNQLDHFIVNDLKIKHYIRYMDDFILIHHDKKLLEKSLDIIRDKLVKEYKLKLNKNKIKLVREDEGFVFLGYNYKVLNKKTIVKIRQDGYKKIKRRVKELKYLYNKKEISIGKTFSSIMTFWYNRKYGSQMKIRRVVNKYWYE